MSAVLENATLRGTTVMTGPVTLPSGTVSASTIAAGANVETSKLVHRHSLNYNQASGASVATATVPVFIARGTTITIRAIEAAILVAAAGAATVTVDLQKSTGGGAFASVLSSTIDFDSASVVRTVTAGTLSATSATDGDILQLVVTATAGGGTLPQGLIVTLTLDETPA